MSADRGFGARLFVALQHVLPQHAATAIVHRLARSRSPLVSRLLIRSFMRSFRPDLSEALEREPAGYASFNDFFTRALAPNTRPLAADPAAIVSPVDGTVSQIGVIDRGRLVQAKGHDYTIEALLAGGAWVERFAAGRFATLYLAPWDYHRIHMPHAGTLRAAWYVPGQLFSVNELTARCVPGLFARNERVICVFEDGSLPFAMILVGALFVGSIATVWHGEVTPRRPREHMELRPREDAAPLHRERGEEMGRFNMGSTVILLLPPGTVTWIPALAPGAKVRMGQALGHLRDTR